MTNKFADNRMKKSIAKKGCDGLLLLTILFSLLAGCKTKDKDPLSDLSNIPYKVTGIFPHDVTAFTQGLVIEQGRLFESTGQDSSWIAEVTLATGKQQKKAVLDKKYFGEGITVLNDKIYQLTWQNKIGFVYDFKTFERLDTFRYEHEGWGITHNGKNLIVSDGTSTLYFKDTTDVNTVNTLTVNFRGEKITGLNELEFIEGYVYANKWQTNDIYKIDPATGDVVGRIDFSRLSNEVKSKFPGVDVLNGIAYEKKSKTLLVTGKLWPALYAIRLDEQPNP